MGFTLPSFWRASTPPTTAQLNEQRALDATATLELEGAQAPQSRTISNGSISPTAAYVIVDTEGGAAADDLDVISPVLSASENLHDGMVIYLKAADSGRVVTVKNSSSANGINTYDGNDYVLSTTHWLKLQLRSGKWYEVEGRAMETALAAATAAANAATAAEHAQTKSGTSSTASGTAAKVVTCAGFELSDQARIFVTFSNANTVADAITLNVNGTGAKSVYNQTGIISTSNTALFAANQPIEFRYDGTGWVFYDAAKVPHFDVSDIIPSFATSKSGFLLCNGGAYSRTTYAALFAILGTSFGSGDGSTTFNVPDFRGRTIQGANANLKAVLAAGLPNFAGFTGALSADSAINGPFYKGGNAYGFTGSSYATGPGTFFDPSRVSSIYGASTTVQSPAIAANIFIKY